MENFKRKLARTVRDMRAVHAASRLSLPLPSLDYLKGRNPKEFNQAMHYLGPIQGYAEEVESLSHDTVIPILTLAEREELRDIISRIKSVNRMILKRL